MQRVSQMRQCGEGALRLFVAPGMRSGGGMCRRIMTISCPVFVSRITGAG
jgi:hypothetical protein